MIYYLPHPIETSDNQKISPNLVHIIKPTNIKIQKNRELLYLV